jgi:hypothetical protein
MKKSFYLIALLGVLFVLPSCQREVITTDDTGLSSPSGMRLAKDFDALGTLIEQTAKAEYGMKVSATVVDVKWENVGGRELAFVRYTDETGEVGNFAVAKSITNTGRSKADIQHEHDLLKVAVSCKNVSCSTGNCALGTRDQNGWTIYQCACNLSGGNFGPGCDVEMVVSATIEAP